MMLIPLLHFTHPGALPRHLAGSRVSFSLYRGLAKRPARTVDHI